jgi:hypothetical protein
MNFTKSALKQKKVDPNGTNKMGQYYNTVRVPIKNYNTASIAKRIDKNMTSLSLTIPDHLTTTSLDDLLKPVLENDTLKFNNEKIPNIFNYRYDSINISTGIAEMVRDFENEEKKIILNNRYQINTEIKLKVFDKHLTAFVDVLNENSNNNSNINSNINSIDLSVLMKIGDTKLNKFDILNENSNNNSNINSNINSIDLSVLMKIGDTKLNKFDILNENRLNENRLNENRLNENRLNENRLNENRLNENRLNENNRNINIEPNITLKMGDTKLIKFDRLNENVLFDYNNYYNKEEDNKKQTIDIPLKILQLTKPIIENVYQEKYKDGVTTGLGDFIRGSYFLMQFCDNNNIPYNINLLNHPISQFLEIYINKQPLIYNNINKFGLTNHNPHILDNHIITNIYDISINDNFIRYLSDQQVFNQKLYVYNISYPTVQINQKHKEYMRHLLKPCFKVALAVDDLLLKLELVKKQFTIIHIRYGDDFLIKNKKETKKSHLEMIKNILDKLDRSHKYLLISDNTIIKNIIQSKYPFIKTHFNEISHTGEGLQLETNKLQNTMIDFYLFSHATKIIAFSVYKHGTGFSKWSAETYNVPYCCRFLK